MSATDSVHDVTPIPATQAEALAPWLDKGGVAEHYGCSTRSIEKAIAEGMPHALIFGRVKFKTAWTDAWLAEHGYLLRRGDWSPLTDNAPGGAGDAPEPDTRRDP